MDPGILGVVMIAAGIVVWIVDRFARPKQPKGAQLEGVIGDVVKAAKDLPLSSLLVVLGFILVLFANGWLRVSAG